MYDLTLYVSFILSLGFVSSKNYKIPHVKSFIVVRQGLKLKKM